MSLAAKAHISSEGPRTEALPVLPTVNRNTGVAKSPSMSIPVVFYVL